VGQGNLQMDLELGQRALILVSPRIISIPITFRPLRGGGEDTGQFMVLSSLVSAGMVIPQLEPSGR
jgi:hypothetical protein